MKQQQGENSLLQSNFHSLLGNERYQLQNGTKYFNLMITIYKEVYNITSFIGIIERP